MTCFRDFFVWLYHHLYAYIPNRLCAKKGPYHDPTECTNILACTMVNNRLGENQLSAVLSRAIPNERLALAFEIDNAFTTREDDYRRTFLALAIRKLASVNWNHITRTAENIVLEKIQASDESRMGIHLVPLFQLLSLKISLQVLFEQDPLALDDEVVSSLAQTINALWILSKDPSPNEEQMRFHQYNLRKDLGSLLPTYRLTPRETPMNFIIPAYETLWRVVLQTFIEVVFRHPSSETTWRSVLAAYMVTPTLARFSQRSPLSLGETPSISAEDLAKEALRLYPPTRRVYRTFQYSPSQAAVLVAADIERLHRDPELWGLDSTTYVPGRWSSITGGDPPGKYFPFGGRPMVCPAKKIFGPRMIATLVAALVGGFETGEWKLEGDEAGEADMKKWNDDPSQPLDSSREAHATLYLCRK